MKYFNVCLSVFIQSNLKKTWYIKPNHESYDVSKSTIHKNKLLIYLKIVAKLVLLFIHLLFRNVKNIAKLGQQELGSDKKGSWHDDYKDSAWIFIGGLPYDLTEGDIIAVFSQYVLVTFDCNTFFYFLL